MRSLLFLLLIIIITSSHSYSKERVLFKLSKPYCLLNFAEAASGNRNISSTLREYIQEQISDPHFYEIITEYQKITLDHAIEQDILPPARQFPRTTFDLIYIAAAKANDIEDLSDRIMGILPNTAHQQLIGVLNKLSPYYDQLLWNNANNTLLKHIDSLSKYSSALSEAFISFKTFYRSSWSDDIPFVVTLYPIPGSKGHVTATAHNSILSIGVLTQEKDYDNRSRASIIAHEMCHILYREEATSVQVEIDRYFQSSMSSYKHIAYSYINEALATACGNGWMYKKLNGVLDTGSWYNNHYINTYAKALYPLVELYITNNKPIDSLFITKAIAVFEKEFPKSIYDYNVLFNNVSIYNDAATKEERKLITDALSQHYNIGAYSMLSPISDSTCIMHINSSKQTQLIIVHKNNEENITLLNNIFPHTKAFTKNKLTENFYLSFLDEHERAVIIINIKDIDSLSDALITIKNQKYIDPNLPFTLLKF